MRTTGRVGPPPQRGGRPHELHVEVDLPTEVSRMEVTAESDVAGGELTRPRDILLIDCLLISCFVAVHAPSQLGCRLNNLNLKPIAADAEG